MIKQLLLYVFQKKNEQMSIEQFTNNVLIIDDQKKEVSGLMMVLENKGINYSFYTPSSIKNKKIKAKQLIFCDLFLSETSSELQGNISELRRILKDNIDTNMGSYGLVLWTNHIEYIAVVKNKISQDSINKSYNTPLFIVGLSKSYYISKNNFASVLSDLNVEIEKDKAAYFFVNWKNKVYSAADKTISNIYRMVPEYEKQSSELVYLMYLMSLQHIGLSERNDIDEYDLTIDAYKAFDELLYSELINQLTTADMINIFNPKPNNPWSKDKSTRLDIMSKINTKLFIDSNNIKQNLILPGNVYEIINGEKIDKQPEESKSIVIELTPPCDVEQKKKVHSKIIKGFISDVSDNFKKDYYYKDLYPIYFENKIQQIYFDFRFVNTIDNADLINPKKYKILFRVNKNLFADILQKYSSYSSRLGLAIVR